MSVDMVPGADLAPSLPSRVVTVNLLDGQEGDWAHDKTVTFTLLGDVHVAADRRIVTADPVVLPLPEGRGRVRLPVWTAESGDWAILVRKSWAPHPYLIRVPAGDSETDLSRISPLMEVPIGVNKDLLLTGASAQVVTDSAWDMSVSVAGGIANFVLHVPEVVVDATKARHLTVDDRLSSLPSGRYIVPTGAIATAAGMPEAVHGVLRVERWGSGPAGLAIFESRETVSRTWTHIWDTSGVPAGWTRRLPYRNEANLTTSDRLDTLRSGLHIVPTGAVATALGLPEALHGVLRVERWGSGSGLAIFESREAPSRTWSYIWHTDGSPLGGWQRANPAAVTVAPSDRPQWLTTFQPGHGWTHSAVTPTPDTTGHLIGSQALRVTATAGQVDTLRSPTLSLDLTGKALVVWARIDSEDAPSTTTGLRILAGDIDGGNYYLWRIIRPAASTGQGKLGEWVQVRLMPETRTGAPSWSNIKQIAIEGPTASARTWTIQAVGTAVLNPRYPRGVISLTFDDAEDEMVEVARRSLTPRGWAATCYAIRERIGTPGWMTADELRELRHVHGWTIAAHGRYDYTTYTPEQLREEWGGDQEWMQGLGLPVPRHMAYMGGQLNASVVRVAQEFFDSGRTIAAGMETDPPADPWRLRAVTAISDSGSGTPPSEVKTWIDRAVRSGAVLHLVFHRVVDTPTSSSDISWAAFEDLLAYIAASGAAVRTVSELM